MRRILVIVTLTITIGLLAAVAISLALRPEGVADDGPWAVTTMGLAGVSFAGVGMVLVLKARGGLVGWLCLGIAWGASLYLAGLGSSLLLPLAAGLLLVFPTGRLPSKRWRWAAWALVAVVALSMAVVAVGLVTGEDMDNTTYLLSLPVAVLIAAAIIRIINDFRVARGDIRDQLKWLATVLVVGSLLLVASMMPIDALSGLNNVAGAVMFVGGPVAIGLAVLRYRLYDIDRILSRTVSYALVVLALAAVYASIALALPRILGLPSDSPLLVAGATLASAALFDPLRRRMRTVIDRRFNRSKYDAEHVLDEFIGRLGSESDLGVVAADLTLVVSEALEPSSVAVWIRQ